MLKNIQIFSIILATYAFVTNAKSNIPSSREVFRPGRHPRTSRRIKKKKKKSSQSFFDRKCSLFHNKNNVTLGFACESGKDTLWFSLDSTENVKIEAIITKGKKSSTPPSKGKQNSIAMRFFELVEYIPTGNVSSYNFDTQVLASYSLDTFEDFTIPNKTNGVYKTSLQTKDKVVTFNYYITERGNGTDIGGNGTDSGLSQHKLKYDIIVEGFKWKQQEGSLLALIAEADTPLGTGKVRKRKHKNTNVYEVEKIDAVLEVLEVADSPTYSVVSGEYTWVPKAEGKNGNEFSIVATQPADQKEEATTQKIAFSFLGSSGEEKITWDPEIGFDYSTRNVKADNSVMSSQFELVPAKQLMLGAFFCLAYLW